jgi:serine/threonine protein kinase
MAVPDEPVKVAGPVPMAAEVPTRAEEEARKLVGRELGSFRIDALVGVGGFGAVYKAFDKSLHRDVALKVLPMSMARLGKDKIQQFLLEARAAAKLSHPDIVTVHQICEADHIYFIVMELVEGKSLADLVKSRRLSPQESTRIIIDACRGLAHAHKRGLIHRDIKPGNIMVTGEGQVKMTDFGLARDIFRESAGEEEGRAVGTPLYMSPEQCEGEEGDSRSDVYAMAATYYVALTRHPPYEGRDTEEVMNHHRFSPPPDPRKILPTLPAAVFRIIEKAMAKEPDERYQTAEDLLHALEGLDFASLDPHAAVSLEAVSAQISPLTPQVGEHVGAVMKQAVRHVDKSTNRSRLVDAIEKTGPLKWYIVAGVVIAVICIAALGFVIWWTLAQRGQRDEAIESHPLSSEAVVSASNQTAAAPAGSTTAKPAAGQTAAPGPSAAPAATEEPPPPAEDAQTVQKEMEANAKAVYEEAQAYEKTAWQTNPTDVFEKYRVVITYYGKTSYAAKAQADLERLQNKADTPAETAAPPATTAAAPKPAETAAAPASATSAEKPAGSDAQPAVTDEQPASTAEKPAATAGTARKPDASKSSKSAKPATK